MGRCPDEQETQTGLSWRMHAAISVHLPRGGNESTKREKQSHGLGIQQKHTSKHKRCWVVGP